MIIPLWMLLVLEPQYLPEPLAFIGPKEKELSIPLFVQFIIVYFGLDLVRWRAFIPSPFATALGLVGVTGRLPWSVGFSPRGALYRPGGARRFSTPSYELSMANRVILLVMIVLTGVFRLPGFLGGIALILLRLFTTRSFGFPYMWPLYPFNLKALLSIFVRRPIPLDMARPS